MFFTGGPKRSYGGFESEGAGQAHGDRGDDVNVRIEIPFALAMSGGETIIKVPRAVDCTRCRGTGAEPGSKVDTCPACGGQGTMQFSQGGFMVNRTCPRCSGKGRIVMQMCKLCGGSGEAQETRKIRIKIPEGVTDGDRLKVKGEGNMRSWNRERGDLYVSFKVTESNIFVRKGDDIFYSVTINPAQAMLGAHLKVPSPDGDVDIKVPAGTHSGTKLRISGHGAKNIKTGKKGDYYVTVEIDMPIISGGEEEEILRKLAEKKGWKI
ncbi:MAG: J domain-containing protein [Spirochaetia bacterium]|nr:J domain-containing protein [Spirochaetia bacterium]